MDLILKSERFEHVLLKNLHSYLNILGLSIMVNDKLKKVKESFIRAAMFVEVVLLLTECVPSYDGLESFSRLTEVLVVLYQTISKMVHLNIFKNKLMTLLSRTQTSWNINEFGEAHHEDLKYPLIVTRGFIFFYMANTGFCAMLYCLVPIFTRSGQLPYMSYPESRGLSSGGYKIMFIVQCLYMSIPVVFIPGYDGIFLYLSAFMITHIRMIKIKFSECFKIQERKKFEDKFRNTIAHHVYILRFIREMNDTYSLILLNQFLSSLAGICISLFLLYMAGTPMDITLAVKYIMFSIAMIFQVAVYCYMGNQLSLEYGTLSDPLFYKVWSGKCFLSTNTITLITHMTQKNQAVSVGGFSDLNLAALIKLLHQSLSFFTFLQVMFDDNE